MKKLSRKARSPSKGDDLRAEYDFSGGVRGKHAARYAQGTNVVVLDPDVAEAFPNPATVNHDSHLWSWLLVERKADL
jgi:hypothetical protein